MPKYALERFYPPTTTRSDVDGMALAGITALQSYLYRGGSKPRTDDHGIRWIRSYWEPGGTWGVCLFEAPSMDVLEDFQGLCGTPFTSAAEIVEIESTAPPSGDTSTKITAVISLPDETPDPGAKLGNLPGSAAGRFVRAYWDEKTHTATALFSSDDPTALATALATPETKKTAQIVEFTPADYA